MAPRCLDGRLKVLLCSSGVDEGLGYCSKIADVFGRRGVRVDLVQPFLSVDGSFDISSDHSIIEAARDTIERGREQLVALEAESRRLEREVVDSKEQLSRVPELEADQHRVRARLRSDLEIRAQQLSMDSLVVLPRHLGQRPMGGVEPAAWDRAAARLEQHRVAFAVTDDRDVLGPTPGIFDDAYAASRRGAQEVTHALQVTIGRERSIEREGPALSW